MSTVICLAVLMFSRFFCVLYIASYFNKVKGRIGRETGSENRIKTNRTRSKTTSSQAHWTSRRRAQVDQDCIVGNSIAILRRSQESKKHRGDQSRFPGLPEQRTSASARHSLCEVSRTGDRQSRLRINTIGEVRANRNGSVLEIKQQGSGWSAQAFCHLSKVACPRGSKIGNQNGTKTAFHRRLARVEAKLDITYRSQFD